MIDVKGYEGLYKVTPEGDIITTARQGSNGGIIKAQVDKKGYKRVKLTKEGNQKTYLVHRLVAIAYIPNPSNKRTVNHINGNTSNNAVENLEWATHSEQMNHSSKVLNRDFKNRNKPELTYDGLQVLKEKGKTVGLSNKKTTLEDELVIIELHKSGMNSTKISEHLGFISRRTVSRILSKYKQGADE